MNLIKRFLATILGLMFYNPRVWPNVNLGSTPATIGITGAVRRQIVDNQIHEVDLTVPDIWATDLMGTIKPGKDQEVSFPKDQMFVQIPTSSYAYKLTLKARRPLQENGVVGDTELPGTEENVRMLFSDLYFNMLSKAVAMRGYGNEFQELDDVGAYKAIPQQLRTYRTEHRCVGIRQAIVLGVEDLLTESFSGSYCVQQFCRNFYVSNILPEDQAVWDDTALTNTAGAADSIGYYSSRTFSGASTSSVEAIGAKLIQGAGLIAAPKAYCTVQDLEAFSFYLNNIVKMPKMKIGNKYGIPVFLNPWQYRYLSRFDGEFKTAVVQAHDFCGPEGSMNWPGLVGEIAGLFIFQDSRGPTMTLTGTAGSYGISVGWVQPGDNDDRNASPWSVTSGSQNLVFDIGYALSPGCLAERVIMADKKLDELQSYGMRKATGFATQRGIQAMKWKTDAGVQIERGIALFVTSRAAINTVRSVSE